MAGAPGAIGGRQDRRRLPSPRTSQRPPRPERFPHDGALLPASPVQCRRADLFRICALLFYFGWPLAPTAGWVSRSGHSRTTLSEFAGREPTVIASLEAPR